MDEFITIRSNDKVYNALKITDFSLGEDDYCVIGVPNSEKNFNIYCMKVVDGNLEEIKDENIKVLTDKIVDCLIALGKEEGKNNGR